MMIRSRFIPHLLVAGLFLLFSFSGLSAATRTASNSGPWNDEATWGGLSVPISADDVFINSGVNVTINVAAACASLTMNQANTDNSITILSSNSLTVGGLLTMERPDWYNSATINVDAGTLICGSLQMETNSSIRYNTINVSSGTLTVSGSTTVSNSISTFNLSGTGSINFAGSLSGSPTLTTVSGSSVNYSGISGQEVIAATYNGTLSIAGTGYKVLSGASTVVENLILSKGTLENGNYLSIGDGATITRSQGSLGAAPSFLGEVDLVYTGASEITTSYEMPISTSTLRNMTVNTGGLVQGGSPGVAENILSEAFGDVDDWEGNGDIGSSYNQFKSNNSSNAGGSRREVKYTWGASSSSSYTASMYRMVSTAGYVSVNIQWSQLIDNYNSDTYKYTIKFQCSTSSSGPWTDMYSLSPTGTGNIGPDDNRISNWTTDVGGDFFVRFYIEGYTYGLDYWYFDDLIIDGQGPATPSTVTVNGALDLSAGTYSIEDNTLDIAGTVSGSDDITGSTASNLIVSGSGSNLSLPNVDVGLNNFTITRAAGVSLSDDLTVNGILDLDNSNPSSTQGLLETGNDTLMMSEPATTVGAGDVTGFVKRTSFLANTIYSFGNEFTDIIFSDEGTFPLSITVAIDIGTSPSWMPAAINRLYDFVQKDGVNTNATISTHYLDSELNGLAENSLAQWTYGNPGPPPGEYCWGKSSNSTSDNWVSIANVGIENFPAVFGQLENTLGAAPDASFVWNGSVSTDWNNADNWTPNVPPIAVPNDSSDIEIPDAGDTSYDPVLPLATSVNSIRIMSGGILEGSALAVFTINGANGAWNNEGGTFNPSTSNVVFTDSAATISGTSNFYDLSIADGANLTPSADNYMGISNALTLTGTGVLMGVQLHNTIEYNGANQTVINPNGPTQGYHNLILSGTGTKTMPGSALSCEGSFSMSGTTSATVGESLTIVEDLTIGAGTSLDLSSYSHSIGGDLTNSGTLSSASSSLSLNGSSEQTITNSDGLSIDNLTISNTDASVVMGTSTSCSIGGDLSIDADAIFDLGENALLSLSGTVINLGTIKTQNTSSTPLPTGIIWDGEIEFNGSSAQTLVLGTYDDLTFNGVNGVSANADVTVNGLISLLLPNASATMGLLDMGSNTLLLGPSSTSTGVGEVSGIIRRTTILANITYTYGHENTSVFFPAVGTLPSELSIKLILGAVPSWKGDAVERVYDLIQTDGENTQALFHSHHLDSELNGNDENLLVDFVHFNLGSTIVEYGRSFYDTEADWIAISNVDVGVFASIFGENEISFGEPGLTALTWNGSVSSSWVTANNWTPPGAPSDSTAITIPAGTLHNLEIPAIATCKSIVLETGAILNASANGNLIVTGGNYIWNNNGGTFNPGTGTVTFSSNDATFSGSNNFYNLTIETDAAVSLESGSYLGISGSLTNLGDLNTIYDGPTTVEYKGTDQFIPSTNRLINTYSSILLSGSGSKTMAIVPLLVDGDLTLSGTVNALADSTITINGNLSIGSGTTFTAGAFRHSILGDYNNDGTLVGTGSNIIFEGSRAQVISGSSANSFDSLTINNANSVSITSDALTTISGALEINNGMHLILPPTKQLTVSGTLTNSSDETGLVLESDASGTASLIHSTEDVEATVERYMDGGKWSIFSTSVSDQSIPDFLDDAGNNIPSQTTNYGMMTYSESAGGWQYFTTASSGNYSHGTGYLLRHNSDDAVSTSGTLNSLTRDVAITRDGNGWNSIGNPFPCAIGAREDASTTQNFLTNNASAMDPSYASLYLWDEPDASAGIDYYKVISNAAFTPSRPVLDMEYLHSGQGFIVKSKVGGGTITFTDAMRVHDNTQSFVKAKRASWPGIILNVESESKSASTSITFNERMTTGLDVTYDAGLLGGDQSFRIYTRLVEDNGVNFMLQCLPDYDYENMIVPIGLKCTDMGAISFSTEAIDLTSDCGVYLEDRKNGIMTDLKDSSASYDVALDSASNGTGRFYLHFASKSVNNTEASKVADYIVYYDRENIIVKGKVEFSSQARLIDISGRVIHIYELENSALNILPVSNLTPGIYLLNLYGKGVSESKKIFIE